MYQFFISAFLYIKRIYYFYLFLALKSECNNASRLFKKFIYIYYALIKIKILKCKRERESESEDIKYFIRYVANNEINKDNM